MIITGKLIKLKRFGEPLNRCKDRNKNILNKYNYFRKKSSILFGTKKHFDPNKDIT